MVKYDYDVTIEGFRRVDRRGRPLYINITEARRIVHMLEMGCSLAKIYSKIDFARDISTTTLRTFAKNYNQGNISVEGDYPTPREIVEEISLSTKVEKLEKRVSDLEDTISEINPRCFISAFASEKKEKKPFWRFWK